MKLQKIYEKVKKYLSLIENDEDIEEKKNRKTSRKNC